MTNPQDCARVAHANELADSARRSARWIREMEPTSMGSIADLLGELADFIATPLQISCPLSQESAKSAEVKAER